MTHCIARNTRAFLLVSAGVGLLTAQIEIQQRTLTPPPGEQQGKPATVFEVASIKPGDPASRGMRVQMPNGSRYNASNVTLKFLIQQAYGVEDFQISGGPGWINSEKYDIVAKADGMLNRESLKPVLQALLADRFKLTLRHETKELPQYALVVAKNGPKLQESSESSSGGMRMGPGHLTGEKIPMAGLANILSRQLGRPVMDKTGLKGMYDFKLEWTPDVSQMKAMGPPLGVEGGDHAPPIDPNGPTLYTALQEQLGLKLDTQKGPTDILVIEHAEKASEN